MKTITFAILIAAAATLVAPVSGQAQEKRWDPNVLRAAIADQASGTGPFAEAIRTCLARKKARQLGLSAGPGCSFKMAETDGTVGDVIGAVNRHRMEDIRNAMGGWKNITPDTRVLKGTVIAVSFGNPKLN